MNRALEACRKFVGHYPNGLSPELDDAYRMALDAVKAAWVRTGKKIDDPEIIMPLTNGCTLRCGSSESFQWGGYLRICDTDGHELFYWDSHEWEEEPEEVIGAVFSAANSSLEELRRVSQKGKE